MFDKKPEKLVKFTEDRGRAKQIRDKAKTKLQQAGIDGKETKKGVGRDVAKTEKGRQEQIKREKINGYVAKNVYERGMEHGLGKRGHKSENEG
jgi:hypothetical protein